jgi:ferredoxin-NADP reductase
LGYTVAHVDQLDDVVPFLQQLGRDHRKFGVAPERYAPVGQALLATLAETHGDSWDAQLAEEWTAAFQVVAKVMTEAAEVAADNGVPPCWKAEVISHQRRSLDIAVVTLRPEPHYPYQAGQSLSLETHLRPRVWRYYSPANAPRVDGSIELHVRQQPGGPVSTALASALRVGDVVTLGPPVGSRLTLAAAPAQDLLLLSGGTGLAPLKALVEAAAVEDHGRQVTLVTGARAPDDLYDQYALIALANKYDWLTVVPVVADATSDAGTPPLVASASRYWRDRHIFICGSDPMVIDTVARLTGYGVPPSRLHYEGFTGLGGDRFGVVEGQESQR